MGAFFSSAGPTPSWCPHPPSWATQGTKKAFDGVISTLENDFGVVFLFLIKHKRRYSANTKKPGNPHDSWTFSWSWKRDLNTRPADYESAALPTELFQRIRNVWALSGMTGSGGRADGAHGIKHNFAALRYVLKYYTQKTGVRQEENADLSKLSDFENSSRSFFSPHRAPFPGILTENKYSNGKKCSMIGAEEARQLQGNRERGNSYA